jgi:hypothetical protein
LLASIAVAAQLLLPVWQAPMALASDGPPSPFLSLVCTTTRPADGEAPPGPNSRHDCPVCWLAQHAGIFIAPPSPSQPSLAVPGSRIESSWSDESAFQRMQAAFDARGPPAVHI